MIKKIILLLLFIPSLLLSQNFWMSSDTLFVIKPDSMNASGGFDVNSSGVITDDNDVLMAFVFDQSTTINHVWTAVTVTPYPIFKAAVTGAAGSGSVTTIEESDSQVGGADIVIINFGPGFDVAENPDMQVNITLDLTEKQVVLTTEVTGNLPVGNLNSGTSASSSTFWRGDATWATVTAAPGGSDTQIQYNNASSLGGISGFIYDGTNIELGDDQDLAFGTDADWLIQYDEGVDNQILFITANTSAIAITDPMFEILVGTTPTTNQEVFGVSKGTQASNTALLALDEDGDLNILGNFTLGGTVDGKDIATNAAMLNEAETILSNWVNTANPWAVNEGGSGAATITGILQGNGTSAITGISNSSTVGQIFRVTGSSTYAWGALDLSDSDAVTGVLPELSGGTGDSNLDDIIGGTAITVTAGANTIIAGDATIAVTADGIGPTQIDETAIYTWSGANLLTGIHEVADDIDFRFGTDADYAINYDESVDNQLLFITAATAAVATTDPMFEFLVGTTPTANQQVFGVAKGTQATNTALFTVDEDGDGEFAGGLTLGTVLPIAQTALVAGTNITLSTNTLNVDNAFIVNDGSDIMAGTLTADGLTLGANENLTLGAQTLDHDGTNFIFNDAVQITGGMIYIDEQAEAGADIANYGQLWVNTATPNEFWFTDDAGTDFQLGLSAGSHAGTITWTGTAILETGVAFQFGDASDATLTHTYANTGTNVSIAYSTAAMAVTGALTSTITGADLTTFGTVELATAAETTTGTDATRALTPDGFAGSTPGTRVVEWPISIDWDTATAVGDNAATFVIPNELAGMNLIDIEGFVKTAGTTGTLNVTLVNVTQSNAEILSTALTIDSAEKTTATAATPAVIDTGEDDMAALDELQVNIDVIHTTPAQGLLLILSFRTP